MMDNLGEALKLCDRVLEELKRPIMLKSRGFQIALAIRLAAVIMLALVDIAGSLREMLGYEEEEKEE